MTQNSSNPEILDSNFKKWTVQLEQALDHFLPKPSLHATQIHEAMRYSVLNGGKRVRPLLCLSVCHMLEGDLEEALIPASAIELIHCYSLVHDDLPSMDNDEFRRGQLTCHKKFGEATALLAGDAMLTLAFQILAQIKDSEKMKRLLSELAQAAGTSGMVGGQAMDLLFTNRDTDLPTLDAIHIQKTGQLIKTSCLAGAVMAGAGKDKEARIVKFGEYLGFAFQIVDDILDGDGYLRFMSAHEARGKAVELIASAKRELEGFKRSQPLLEIANLVLNRTQDQ
jgi:geranylgeranyl diphosphate synthase type II